MTRPWYLSPHLSTVVCQQDFILQQHGSCQSSASARCSSWTVMQAPGDAHGVFHVSCRPMHMTIHKHPTGCWAEGLC